MTEGGSYDVPILADPESLLGMLQRGRGKGYLMAMEKPPEEVWQFLLECTANSPTIDFWIGDGSDYYAALMVATGMDLEPMRSRLRENNDAGRASAPEPGPTDLGLTLGTLALLANKGNNQAMRILKEYVSFGWRWSQVILELSELDIPGALEGLDEILCRRIATDESFRAKFAAEVREDWGWYCRRDLEARAKGGWLTLPMYEPWRTLCARNSRLASQFADVGIAFDQAPPPPETIAEAELEKLSLAEAFALVDKSNFAPLARFITKKVSAEDEEYLLQNLSSDNWHRVVLAFRGLGQIGTPKACEAVKTYIEAGGNTGQGVPPAASRAFEQMPVSLTLDTARKWFQGRESHLHFSACCILRQHATLDDVPMLIEALRMPKVVQGVELHLWSILKAFARFPGIGPIPELEAVFCETGHYLDRCQAATAMAVTSPLHFRHEYAFECLWDYCDDTRKLGCDTVNLTIPGALERLKELTDEDEYDDVRVAAQKRLEGF